MCVSITVLNPKASLTTDDMFHDNMSESSIVMG